MATASEFPPNRETTKKFVNLCATTFGWGDLSEDTVMDLGCGEELNCSRTLLQNFPKVKSIIALDGNYTQLAGITLESPRISRLLADILKRTDINVFEGKIDKVVSTHVLHQIPDKARVFENVYRLLKPGGEAAFLFTADLGIYHVLKALKRDPKYKDYFKGSIQFEMYSKELKAGDFREMLGKIGFKVIEIAEEKAYYSNDLFRKVKEYLIDYAAIAFEVPSELVPDINSTATHLYRTMYCEQDTMYFTTEMSIFVTKPPDADTKCSNE